MARYTTAHARQTRHNIVEAARRRFKRDGIHGSGLTALLGDAGLTNGAFYKHFDSKDDLVAAVVAYDFDKLLDWLAAQPTGRATVEKYIRNYCRASHRDQPEKGCLSSAVLPEIGRGGVATRTNYTQGLKNYLRLLAVHLRPDHGAAAEDRALELLALMCGSMQLSRAVADVDFADQILERVLTTACSRFLEPQFERRD